jgi:hypothetical protein
MFLITAQPIQLGHHQYTPGCLAMLDGLLQNGSILGILSTFKFNELVADRGTFDSCVVPDNLPLGRLTRIFLLLGRYSEVWRPFSHKYIDLNCKKVNMLL